jgi:hypothetical protein
MGHSQHRCRSTLSALNRGWWWWEWWRGRGKRGGRGRRLLCLRFVARARARWDSCFANEWADGPVEVDADVVDWRFLPGATVSNCVGRGEREGGATMRSQASSSPPKARPHDDPPQHNTKKPTVNAVLQHHPPIQTTARISPRQKQIARTNNNTTDRNRLVILTRPPA